jgi:hypothetical protein
MFGQEAIDTVFIVRTVSKRQSSTKTMIFKPKRTEREQTGDKLK